jgi:hypothetical protein
MTPNLDSFARFVAAIEPWLPRLVFIGGWAHRLYRMHPHAQALEYPPLMTLDTDVAMPAALPIGESVIRERLLAHGFTEDFMGADHPPATHYHLRDAGGFYAEFLTPLSGAPSERSGKRKATAAVGGVVSQQLRHIDLLLCAPWTVEFTNARDSAELQVANPASFLAQKTLIHKARDRRNRAKDVLYMHDTLELFGSALPELRRLWRDVLAPGLPPRTAATVSRASRDLFDEVTDDIRRAADIAADRGLTPETVRLVCSYGFEQVFL